MGLKLKIFLRGLENLSFFDITLERTAIGSIQKRHNNGYSSGYFCLFEVKLVEVQEKS